MVGTVSGLFSVLIGFFLTNMFDKTIIIAAMSDAAILYKLLVLWFSGSDFQAICLELREVSGHQTSRK